jgi:hypothetical protein
VGAVWAVLAEVCRGRGCALVCMTVSPPSKSLAALPCSAIPYPTLPNPALPLLAHGVAGAPFMCVQAAEVIFRSVVQEGDSTLHASNFQDAVMLLSARVEQVKEDKSESLFCGTIPASSVSRARVAVRRFLCKSVFLLNTEVVWFEVGMFCMVALSMTVSVITLNRCISKKVMYDDSLEGVQSVTLSAFVLEVCVCVGAGRDIPPQAPRPFKPRPLHSNALSPLTPSPGMLGLPGRVEAVCVRTPPVLAKRCALPGLRADHP